VRGPCLAIAERRSRGSGYPPGVSASPFPEAPGELDERTELEELARSERQASETPDDPWAEEVTEVVKSTDVGGFLGDRFRVDARLGVGAMGRVLTAVDMKTGTLVALKVLHKDRQRDPAVVERFRREAAVLREMLHPAIVRLVAFGQAADGTWWLAMEHLVGKTLRDRLAAGGPYAPREAWPVLATLCDGVALAHSRGILHRDLKPDNVLLLSSGLPPCKILDFGLSRYTAKADRITATGMVLGTPRYMAPEMLHENAPIDERAEVFAIGAIAFEMLTGRSVYPAEDLGQLFGCILEGRTLSLRSLRPDASPELEKTIADALARDPQRRIRSVGELAVRLARAIGVPEDRSCFLPGSDAPETSAGAHDTARDLRRPAHLLGGQSRTLAGPAPSPLEEPPSPPPSARAPLSPASLATALLTTAGGPPPPAASTSTRHHLGGVAPPASFTPPGPSSSSSPPQRPAWLWIALFVLTAIVAMVAAGAIAAYALSVAIAR
jgi:serine/threonine protein kinase